MMLSLDNHYLLSSSLDGSIKLWDPVIGQCLHTFSTGNQSLLSAALSNDKGIALSAGVDGNVHVWALDWELEDTKGHWDKGATAYLKAFLKQHTPQSLKLSYKTDLSVTGDGKSQVHTGEPVYGERDLKELYFIMGCAGYHKVEHDRIKSELQNLALEMKEEKEKQTDITSRRTLADFAKDKGSKAAAPLKKKRTAGRWVKHISTIAISIFFISLMWLVYDFYKQSVEDTQLQVAMERVKQGEDINQALANGQTLLHFAARDGHLRVAKFLIANGAYLNKRDNINWTPLYHAVSADRAEMVRLLIQHGAETNLVAGAEKISPLKLAQDNENEEIAQILQEAIRLRP
jgi:hypothetical protein